MISAETKLVNLNKLLYIVVVISASVYSSTLFAEKFFSDTRVGFYLGSWHPPHATFPGVNEVNPGVSIGKNLNYENKSLLLEIGYFKNSFSDNTYWIGFEPYKISLAKFDLALHFRHYQTENNTYANRLLTPMLRMEYKLSDRFGIVTHLRKSGAIFSINLNL